jgi:hypothetical protein
MLLDRCNLAKFLEYKALKILHNVMTRWIPMLFLAKWILTKYKILVIQMFQEQVSNESTKAKLELLCDIEFIMPKMSFYD